MEPNGSNEPPGIDEPALEARAQALLARHGPKALQRMVDDIQHALRLGDEASAAYSARLLDRIQCLIDTRNK